ncbi:MAG TPA: hypothetical protein VGC13_19855 [Longimicrobium sp.]|jgi:hypothetical protein|uniref:hypothetical protein n=1 Tax=Longimicrobium sp. TaxID=2029185 RepID=UPI002EDB0C01
MKHYMHRSSWLLALLVVVVGELSAQATLQSPRTPSRVPVTVALVEQLPYPDAPFIILRQSAGSDYILLPADADAALLTDAVNALLLARQRGGDRATADAVLRAQVPERVRGARPLPWVARVLADLRSAPRRSLPRVGQAPAVQIWLPRQNRPQPAPPSRQG